MASTSAGPFAALLLLALALLAWGWTQRQRALRQAELFQGEQAQRELVQRLYRVLVSCNEAMAAGGTPQQLCDGVCRILVEEGLFRMAWIGLPDAAGQALVPLAAHGAGIDYLQGLHVSLHDDVQGQGPSGTAYRSGRPDLCQDIAAETRMAPWREQAAAHGYGSSGALPVLVDGRPGAVLSVYAAQRHYFDDEKRELLQRLAANLGLALRLRATDEARAQAARAQTASLEQAVAERTAEFKQLVDALPDLYFRMDADGTILDFRANRAADLLLPPEQFIGQRLVNLLPAPAGPQVQAALAEALASMRMVLVEYALPMPGGLQHFEARLVAAAGQEGLAIVRNITERKALEAAREAALAEAERLARVKSQFLANMSHEIRTPLNAVLGLAQLGAQSATDASAREGFVRILDAGRLLLGIVNDVLDLSRLEAGMLRIDELPTDPRALLERAAALLAPRAAEKGLPLVVVCAAAVPTAVLGDPLRIEQVLVNLLSNAIKFTDAGEVRLAAETSGEALVFSVHDSGAGLSEEALARLFVPFQQLDASTTRRQGGSGLGLAISQQLARLMGGDLVVRSQPGQGSCFSLRLPLRPATMPLAPPAALPAPATPAAQTLAGLRVLVVEDNPVNQLVLEGMLTLHGASVVTAGNGRLALQEVQADGGARFDIVLMDVQMPEMDGWQTTAQMRRLAPGLPIVGQTAFALAEERERCLAAGMVAHLAKPIDIGALVRVVLAHARAPGQIQARRTATGSGTPEAPIS